MDEPDFELEQFIRNKKTPSFKDITKNIKGDVIAYTTRRRGSPPSGFYLINSKLYKGHQDITPLSKPEVISLQDELKHNRLKRLKDESTPKKHNHSITDYQHYKPLILSFLNNNKGKAYSFDEIAHNVQFKVIDKHDKRDFILILDKSKIDNRYHEGITYYF